MRRSLIQKLKLTFQSQMHALREAPGYSACFKELGALVHFAKSLAPFQLPQRLEALTRAYSLAQSRFTIRLIARVLTRYLPPPADSKLTTKIPLWEKYQIGWSRYRSQLDASPAATRTLIIKAPGPNGEKGVVVSNFEYNYLRILSGIHPFDQFDENYTLVFFTSWSPTNYNILALALEKIAGPVFIVPSNLKECNKLKTFHPRIHPLDFLACDWLNPEKFLPKPWQKRDIDILMVANWAPFKRHWHFFRILHELPTNLRVVCIGQPEGIYTLDYIQRLKEKFDVPQKIEFLERIPIEEVNQLQCRSKIAIVLSRREGSCIAAIEGMMGGAFLALLEDSHIGSLHHINNQNGIRLKPNTASEQLRKLLEAEPISSPHDWAAKNISCHQTTEKLNQSLKKQAVTDELPWSEDIAVPYWRPFPCFASSSDEARLSPAADDLSKDYPEVFPLGWIAKSRF